MTKKKLSTSEKIRRGLSKTASGLKNVASSKRFQYGLSEAGKRSMEIGGVSLNKKEQIRGGVSDFGFNMMHSAGFDIRPKKRKK